MFRPRLQTSSIISRIALFNVAIAAVLGSSNTLWAVGLNYVDANDFTNLTPATGIVFPNAGADNLWGVRTDFGLGLTVFESAATEDAPQLTQKISGLTSGVSYDVYGVFATDDDENWNLHAGITAGNLSSYSFWGNRGPFPIPNSTQGITAGAAVWDTLPPANKEGKFFTERNEIVAPATLPDPLVILLGKAGTTTANASGEINVLLDDLGVATGGRRSWLEGVAYVAAGTQISLQTSLNRDTGAITITNPTTTPFQVKSYSIESTAGGLDATAWTQVAGWDVTATPDATAPYATRLAQTDPAGTGFTIAANGGTRSFGSLWNASSFEDVIVRLTLANDEIAVIVPSYSGTQVVAGDFNASGAINIDDFQTLLTNLHTTAAASQAEAFQRGDMNGDRSINFIDFSLFRTAYDAANGAGSFAQLVPEPSTLGMLLGIVAACVVGIRRRAAAFVMALAVSLASVVPTNAATLLAVDVDARLGDSTAGPPGDNTVAGFSSFTMTTGTTGPLVSSTAVINGYTITLTAVDVNGVPLAAGGLDDRDRATPTTAPTLNQLYDDFIFANVATTGVGGGVDMAINSGGALLPNTQYTVSVYSFDTGSTTPTPRTANWLDGNSLDAQVFQSSFPGATSPTTDDQYKFGGAFMTDGSGNLLLRARETTGASHGVFINGFEISDDEPPPPPVELTLEINSATGAVRIVNEQTVSFDMSYYEIRSGAGSLNPAGWTSLDDAEGGDPVGTGWDEAVASTANILSEVNLSSLRTVDPGSSFSLGSAFTPGGNENIAFVYAGPTETALRTGLVKFVTGPGGVNGDYNGNGTVDAADYVVWRKNLNTGTTLPNDTTPGNVSQADYDVWRANFGRVGGAGAALVEGSAVPEPHALLLALSTVASLLWFRRR